jgi:dimethylhistidine N-methyltransferase
VKVRSALPSGRGVAIDAARAAFALDVQYYLSQEPRQLPSRYFYDALGSRLFEAICQLPWYSITRAEMRLLERHASEVLAETGPLARIVELGCGSGQKLATLLGGRPVAAAEVDLHLIDVSRSALDESVRTLERLDGVHLLTDEASYEVGLSHLRDRSGHGRTLVLFLGSNIGNFDPPGAHEFLREIRAVLRKGDRLLLGADLVKPEPVLRLAYDDPLGVTAAFNRNLLVRINRELDGDFDLPAFSHRASWNGHESRVEMHLVSRRRQDVHIPAAGLRITLQRGESIWTESSYKYTIDGLTSLIQGTAFQPIRHWIDGEDRFALILSAAV